MRIFLGVALALCAASFAIACHSSATSDDCGGTTTRPDDYVLSFPLPSSCDVDGGDGGIACAPVCMQDCPQPTVAYTFAHSCAIVTGDGGDAGLVFACTYTAYPVDNACK